MRISDWSSDVCSSDLRILFVAFQVVGLENEVQQPGILEQVVFGLHRADVVLEILYVGLDVGTLDVALIILAVVFVTRIGAVRGGLLGQQCLADRKSTRLNSSH